MFISNLTYYYKIQTNEVGTKIVLGRGLSHRRSSRMIKLEELDIVKNPENSGSFRDRVAGSNRRISYEISARKSVSILQRQASRDSTSPGQFLSSPALRHDSTEAFEVENTTQPVEKNELNPIQINNINNNDNSQPKVETSPNIEKIPGKQTTPKTKQATDQKEKKPAPIQKQNSYISQHAHLYPVELIPCFEERTAEIPMNDLSNIEFLIYGSNSGISTANLRGKGRVILKLMKEDCYNREVAYHEYVTEHDVLARIRYASNESIHNT